MCVCKCMCLLLQSDRYIWWRFTEQCNTKVVSSLGFVSFLVMYWLLFFLRYDDKALTQRVLTPWQQNVKHSIFISVAAHKNSLSSDVGLPCWTYDVQTQPVTWLSIHNRKQREQKKKCCSFSSQTCVKEWTTLSCPRDNMRGSCKSLKHFGYHGVDKDGSNHQGH